MPRFIVAHVSPGRRKIKSLASHGAASDPPTMHLFVYGTLRRSAEHPMHHLLESSIFVGFARFQGKLYDLGAYPAAAASDDPADSVRGEVYLLPDPVRILARLDRYEGCDPATAEPHEYVRMTIDVHLETSGPVPLPVQIYLYNRPVDRWPQITRGDWLERRTSGAADSPEK